VIPAIPFLLATVLAAAEDKDTSLDNVRRLVLLNQFAEAYAMLIAMERMDLVAKICAKVSKGVDRSPEEVRGIKLHNLTKTYAVRAVRAQGGWSFWDGWVTHEMFPPRLSNWFDTNSTMKRSWGDFPACGSNFWNDEAFTTNLDVYSRSNEVRNFRIDRDYLFFDVLVDDTTRTFEAYFRRERTDEHSHWTVSQPEILHDYREEELSIMEYLFDEGIYHLVRGGDSIASGGSKDIFEAAKYCERARLANPTISDEELMVIAKEVIAKVAENWRSR
jgi:hypothetical protein